MFSWDPNDHKGLQSDWTEASWVHSILLQKLYRKKKDWNAWTQISTGAILSIALCSCWSQTPACMTIANWSEGRLSLNVGIVSIPPDTSALHLQLLSCPLCPKGSPWPSLYCLGRVKHNMPWSPGLLHTYPDHPVSCWPHSPYQTNTPHIIITTTLTQGLWAKVKSCICMDGNCHHRHHSHHQPPHIIITTTLSKGQGFYVWMTITIIIIILIIITIITNTLTKVKGCMYGWAETGWWACPLSSGRRENTLLCNSCQNHFHHCHQNHHHSDHYHHHHHIH